MKFHCVICLNSQDGDAFNGMGLEVPMATPCGHIFHKKCLTRWIRTREIQGIQSEYDDDGDDFDLRCPMCNILFEEEECIRLYPVDPETVDEQTQTPAIINQESGTDIAGLLDFVQLKLKEKWKAEREVQLLQEKLRRLSRTNSDLEGLLCMGMDLVQEIGCCCREHGEKKKGKFQKVKDFMMKGFRSFINPGEFHRD